MTRENKRYNVSLLIEVDPEANFLELHNGDNEDVIEEIVKGLIYDMDDIKCLDVEAEVI